MTTNFFCLPQSGNVFGDTKIILGNEHFSVFHNNLRPLSQVSFLTWTLFLQLALHIIICQLKLYMYQFLKIVFYYSPFTFCNFLSASLTRPSGIIMEIHGNIVMIWGIIKTRSINFWVLYFCKLTSCVIMEAIFTLFMKENIASKSHDIWRSELHFLFYGGSN